MLEIHSSRAGATENRPRTANLYTNEPFAGPLLRAMWVTEGEINTLLEQRIRRLSSAISSLQVA